MTTYRYLAPAPSPNVEVPSPRMLDLVLPSKQEYDAGATDFFGALCKTEI